MKKFSLILASYEEYKLLFWVLFFSNYWPLLSNISKSQVPEDRHCLKRNTHTSFDLSSFILNEIWRCHGFGKPKQPKERLIWFKTGYPCPLNTKINGLIGYSKSGKGSEMKSDQVSDILAPKCSSTSNVSSSREV